MSDALKKAEDHAGQKNIDPNALLQARLFPDMFPLVRQVQIASDFSKGIVSRLACAKVPSGLDMEVSFTDLEALIAQALAHLESFKPEQFDLSESREIVLRPGTPKEKKLTASAYLLHYGLPPFFFQVTTAYAILRHNGVEICKRDYMDTYEDERYHTASAVTNAFIAARFQPIVDGGATYPKQLQFQRLFCRVDSTGNCWSIRSRTTVLRAIWALAGWCRSCAASNVWPRWSRGAQTERTRRSPIAHLKNSLLR